MIERRGIGRSISDTMNAFKRTFGPINPLILSTELLSLLICGTVKSQLFALKHYATWILLLTTITVGIAEQGIPAGNKFKEKISRSVDPSKMDAERREIFMETVRGKWFDYEEDNAYWRHKGRVAINQRLKKIRNNNNVAKNVIFFLGDGMSIPTLTAARIYQGQLQNKPGEEGSLWWEAFPYTGLVKTWCLDAQVPDSACTSTAYLSGIRGKLLTLGLNGKAKRGWCNTQTEENYAHSILKWAQDHGKATGIVTTARITDASPAGAYAHAASYKWETDTDMAFWKPDPQICPDIATQFVGSRPGKDFKVVLGGGRRSFLPKTFKDEEGAFGRRSDGKNLIEEWLLEKQYRNRQANYISSRRQLHDVIDNPEEYDYVLGLFDSSHLQYHLDNTSAKNPTLSEMTEAAIKIVQKENRGYFLFIEGARIDDAHHENYAKIALDETVELSKAVEKATEMTSELDTLIIVTADHGHTMTISGYPRRGNPINGMTALKADDGTPYATLSYQSGPGYRSQTDGNSYDPTSEAYDDTFYRSPALVPMAKASHGGEDVAIFAQGPWSEMFTGYMEQSDIPHFLGYASCIGD